MRPAAILPVKRFARAKQRLGASVEDPLRLALARAMVADVMLELSLTRAIERPIVVPCEESRAAGGRKSGQPAAAGLGVDRALAEGFQRVLCVPGNCPALDPAELEALLSDEGPTREKCG